MDDIEKLLTDDIKSHFEQSDSTAPSLKNILNSLLVLKYFGSGMLTGSEAGILSASEINVDGKDFVTLTNDSDTLLVHAKNDAKLLNAHKQLPFLKQIKKQNFEKEAKWAHKCIKVLNSDFCEQFNSDHFKNCVRDTDELCSDTNDCKWCEYCDPIKLNFGSRLLSVVSKQTKKCKMLTADKIKTPRRFSKNMSDLKEKYINSSKIILNSVFLAYNYKLMNDLSIKMNIKAQRLTDSKMDESKIDESRNILKRNQTLVDYLKKVKREIGRSNRSHESKIDLLKNFKEGLLK